MLTSGLQDPASHESVPAQPGAAGSALSTPARSKPDGPAESANGRADAAAAGLHGATTKNDGAGWIPTKSAPTAAVSAETAVANGPNATGTNAHEPSWPAEPDGRVPRHATTLIRAHGCDDAARHASAAATSLPAADDAQ